MGYQVRGAVQTASFFSVVFSILPRTTIVFLNVPGSVLRSQDHLGRVGDLVMGEGETGTTSAEESLVLKQ